MFFSLLLQKMHLWLDSWIPFSCFDFEVLLYADCHKPPREISPIFQCAFLDYYALCDYVTGRELRSLGSKSWMCKSPHFLTLESTLCYVICPSHLSLHGWLHCRYINPWCLFAYVSGWDAKNLNKMLISDEYKFKKSVGVVMVAWEQTRMKLLIKSWKKKHWKMNWKR